MKTKGRSYSIAVAGFILALMAGAAALLSGPGTNCGLWDYRTGLSVLRWAAYAGAAAAALSLIGLIASIRVKAVRGFMWALLGIVVGGCLAGLMLHFKQVAGTVPRIHDITTDTQSPPEFKEVLRLRKRSENSPVYEGEKVAVLQREAYPDIVPLRLSIPPDQAFEKALDVARRSGWQIIGTDKETGRIEAVATTFWFGFRDDVVIRLRQDGSGSLVDVRSQSRVGLSDLGKNAERIRKFLREMR